MRPPVLLLCGSSLGPIRRIEGFCPCKRQARLGPRCLSTRLAAFTQEKQRPGVPVGNHRCRAGRENINYAQESMGKDSEDRILPHPAQPLLVRLQNHLQTDAASIFFNVSAAVTVEF